MYKWKKEVLERKLKNRRIISWANVRSAHGSVTIYCPHGNSIKKWTTEVPSSGIKCSGLLTFNIKVIMRENSNWWNRLYHIFSEFFSCITQPVWRLIYVLFDRWVGVSISGEGKLFFSAPQRPYCLLPAPDRCTVDNGGFFLGGKAAGAWSSVLKQRMVALYVYSPIRLHGLWIYKIRYSNVKCKASATLRGIR